jgi:hypothetical protein
MSGDTASFAYHFIIGAIITQVLLLSISVHYGPLGNAGAIQDPGAIWDGIASQLTATRLLLFGLFDCAGGLGFSALANGRMSGLLTHS